MRAFPLFDPYVNLRHALAGTGYRFVYIGNYNDSDAVRGEFFLHGREHFPKMVLINEYPPSRPQHACTCHVIRNPTPAIVDGLVSFYPRQCGCRLIVDASAPFWGGGEVIYEGDAVLPRPATEMADAVRRAAAAADMVTVPWESYAVALRMREGLKSMCVPDYDGDESFEKHALGWGAAIVAARSRAVKAT